MDYFALRLVAPDERLAILIFNCEGQKECVYEPGGWYAASHCGQSVMISQTLKVTGAELEHQFEWQRERDKETAEYEAEERRALGQKN